LKHRESLLTNSLTWRPSNTRTKSTSSKC